MGLRLFSGGRWSDDSLNTINVRAVLDNAKDVLYQRLPFTKKPQNSRRCKESRWFKLKK